MPSGSHGGRSGGSHGGFSGGGGGSFGFRNGGSFRHRPRGPRTVVFFGRPVILTSARQFVLSIVTFFVVIAAMCTFAFGSSRSYAKDKIAMIEEEQRYYLQMISDAEADPSLQVMAKVTGVFYKTEYGKYYITYEFGTEDYEGYSFSVYSLESAPKKGSSIKLAVDDEDIDSTTDSIPMDYKNFTLEDDGEYMYQKAQLQSNTTMMIGGIIVIVALVGGIILVYATAKRKEEEKKEKEEREQEARDAFEIQKRYCRYCGTRVNDTDRNCPQCGATLL